MLSPSTPSRTDPATPVPDHYPKGAATLQHSLIRNSARQRDTFEHIDFWMKSIKEYEAKAVLPRDGERIAKWYFEQSKKHSYQVEGWKVNDKFTAIFEQFRNDEFYHLKNLLEIVMREMVEILLLEQGFGQVEVLRTSDTDDVMGGVDLLVNARKPNETRVSSWGIDLTVVTKDELLEKKSAKTQTKVREYHTSVGLPPETLIEREVLPTDPAVMSYFLVHYMAAIARGAQLTAAQKLQMYDDALRHGNKSTVASIREKTKSRVSGLLH